MLVFDCFGLLLFAIDFCPFLFYTFFKAGIDKSMEWSMVPACPSLMCFFNRGNTEGINSSKNLFDDCVCFVIYMKICVRTDFVVLGEFVVR